MAPKPSFYDVIGIVVENACSDEKENML
jgi:hypothetical protein